MYPKGRFASYEGDDPDASQQKSRPRARRHEPGPALGQDGHTGPDGRDYPDPLGRPYGFQCPKEHLELLIHAERWPVAIIRRSRAKRRNGRSALSRAARPCQYRPIVIGGLERGVTIQTVAEVNEL
jgi:hypothetical protein